MKGLRSDSYMHLVRGRRTRMSLRALVVLVAAGALWLLNPYVLVRIAPIFAVGPTRGVVPTDPMFGTVSAMALSVLGTGWLGSILVANPASSLLIGLLSPFISLLVAFGVSDRAHDHNAFRVTFVCGCLFLGVSSLVGGTVCFLRREKA